MYLHYESSDLFIYVSLEINLYCLNMSTKQVRVSNVIMGRKLPTGPIPILDKGGHVLPSGVEADSLVRAVEK